MLIVRIFFESCLVFLIVVNREDEVHFSANKVKTRKLDKLPRPHFEILPIHKEASLLAILLKDVAK
jgi:hypothetical protein